MELAKFQLASTLLTVMVVAAPAVCVVGVPDLPVALPGDAVSPGIRTCSFVTAPALTIVAAPIFGVIGEPLVSVAVTDQPDALAVLKVKLKV